MLDRFKQLWQQGMRMHRDRAAGEDRAILSEVRMVGAGLIMVLISALVLTEIFGAVDVSNGPFSGVADSLETTGVSALTLLTVGFLVVAATAIMRFFGAGLGGGSR